jgi:hypothetical protein
MSWDCRSRKSNGTIDEENLDFGVWISEFGSGAGAESRSGLRVGRHAVCALPDSP